MCAVVCAAGARADDVVVLSDGAGKQTADVVAALTLAGHRVRQRDGDAALVDDGAAVLALGKRSAQRLAASDVKRRAALLVSDKDAPPNLASVVVDVPLRDQLRWIARALPGRPRVVVGRHPARAGALDEALAAAAAAAGLVAVTVDVDGPGAAVAAVEAGLSRAGGGKAVLLLVADDAVVTADTIAPLMQAAFRARVPVVGFSPYFAKVGAVAVVVADTAVSAVEALALAQAPCGPPPPTSSPPTAPPPTCAHRPSASAGLLVDGRLAERLGIPVRDGPNIEVRR